MSYDLWFCRHKGEPLSFDDVAQWAEKQPHFTRECPNQIWYKNPSTGVYFVLETWSTEEESPEVIPETYEDIRLVFNINFVRPSFFAHEAMPIVEQLQRELSLLATEGQEPRTWIAEELIKSWENTNTWAVRDVPDLKASTLYMPREKSFSYWRYMFDHSSLVLRLETQDVFVPKIFLIKPTDADQVQTMVAWTESVHMIIPECDWFAVRRSQRRLLTSEKEMGLVASRDVLGAVDHLLEGFDDERGLKILRPQNVEAVKRAFQGLKFQRRLAEVSQVPPDGFIDVPPA